MRARNTARRKLPRSWIPDPCSALHVSLGCLVLLHDDGHHIAFAYPSGTRSHPHMPVDAEFHGQRFARPFFDEVKIAGALSGANALTGKVQRLEQAVTRRK